MADDYSAIYSSVNAKNAALQAQVEGILQKVISLYQPGGGAETKAKAELESQKEQAVTKGYSEAMSTAISRGLGGTTMAPTQAGVGMQWEKQVGTSARAKLEDYYTSKYAEAMSQYASFLGGISYPYPQLGQAASAVETASSVPTTGNILPTNYQSSTSTPTTYQQAASYTSPTYSSVYSPTTSTGTTGTTYPSQYGTTTQAAQSYQSAYYTPETLYNVLLKEIGTAADTPYSIMNYKL